MADCEHENAFRNRLNCMTCPDCDAVFLACEGCLRLKAYLYKLVHYVCEERAHYAMSRRRVAEVTDMFMEDIDEASDGGKG